MNHVATILGLPLPTLSAKALVMKHTPSTRRCEDKEIQLINHEGSFLLEPRKPVMSKDDDTASTLSASDSDISFSGHMVRFADPVVTEVHTRPYTTPAEKFFLYYTASDYLDFRIDSYNARCSERRKRVIRFADNVVTDIWTVPSLKRHAKDLYYSETELQEFLDDFIASLENGLDR
eukprot:CAMPEP_0116579084 /NCGR_PEP_ID=MMETSP0397-20121206/22064_1 /TAXON_ID=216820 /ORGANISM="Cyclophora tenuis, Strain ECT3854" /LENGTH=176 /DNA_ID=CAMNT_0004108543 /DNA_START=67 /DNA_END=597 /DNA_ORIENTATION=+